MSDKFTIKFKGILDHAATKKAIEQDISKMEKYLKPKKSSLGSTKDIVKNNLSDKKKELNGQSKFESLRERVKKYRLTQTKKAIEQDISKMEKYLKPKKSSLGSTKDIVKNNLSDKKKELNGQSKFESLRERVEKYRLTQTKKAIEQDISKMEKYLKPKKSSLGSTKDIVKNNLSDKKKELNGQSKFESLRERVEKYRLTQTKKLMKQGMGFEKARKEAFKRSLMSDRDKRCLEYKELAKGSKAKSKMLAASQGKGLVAKIAIGSALGNVIGNAISKVGGGFFGFITGFIKKSVEAVSKKEKAQKLNTAFYTTQQRKILMGDEEENIKGIFHGKKGFERDLEKEEFLRHFTLVKGTLTEMNKLTETNLENTGNFMAELVSSGQASMQEAAAAIDDYLRENGDMLYKIMVGKKVGWKYTQAAKDNFQKAVIHKDFGFRLTELQKVAADFHSFKLAEFAGEKEKIDSNMIKLEQSLMDVTTTGMQPVLEGASRLIDWVQSLINTYNKEGFTGIISNIVSVIMDPILQPFKNLINMFVNNPVVQKIAYWLGKR